MREKKRVIRKGSTVRVDHPIIQKKINESLKLSVKEGAFTSVSNGFGLSYLSPFALILNATASQMGILYAIISLLPNLIQLKATTLIKKFSRKKITITGVLISTLLWIPIALMGLLYYLGIPHVVWMLIGLIGLFYSINAIVQPTWFSWMGSLVPENGRGKYFSKRNMASGLFGVITMIIAAIMLDTMKKTGEYFGNTIGFTILGFTLLFILAIMARMYCVKLLHKQYEPRLHLRKKDYFTFKQFLKHCTTTSFGKFSIFRLSLSFAISIAGPFWAVYMLRNLEMSYTWYMMITVSTVLFRLMFLPMLGKFSDKFGNIKLMKMCSWLIALIPLLWVGSALIANDLAIKLYLLFIPSIVAGISWAGYELATNNYIYDAVSSPKRSFGVSYMNLMVGIGSFLGAVFGSFLALLQIPFMNTLLFIFIMSSFFRFISAIFGTRLLHEVRHVKKFSYEFLLQEFQPMRGLRREVHNLEHMVKRNEHYI